MIELAILGLLKDQDLHGYELRRQVGELSGSRPTVSFGSLYPALGRLERDGYVKAVTHETTPTPPAPMSGSLQGELAAFRAHRRRSRARRDARGARGKKVYGLTGEGQARLHDLLVAPDVDDDRDFALRLTFCHDLSPAERLALFEQRRHVLLQRRERGRHRTGPGGGRPSSYLRSLFEHDAASLTADLVWLERLIAAERQTAAGTIDAGDPPAPTHTTDNTGGQR
jgi:DNA-binding PadR family transcriptional regulator